MLTAHRSAAAAAARRAWQQQQRQQQQLTQQQQQQQQQQQHGSHPCSQGGGFRVFLRFYLQAVPELPAFEGIGAPPRRLQAGVSIDDQDKAQKGFIIIWMCISLVFVLVLGVWVVLKIADVTDPLLHTKFLSTR
ncbi:hypothetical protein, conserved [Eimeria brunetti]|uniref:Uncharacterized protein n=1 Tax=Eimeria brunetti TaxID=51314 RepID=U6LQ52_9EIME|nr:hypothetical protein, conserved [Eimeria brunetti]